jgi:hypothetical protein
MPRPTPGSPGNSSPSGAEEERGVKYAIRIPSNDAME